MHNRSFNWSHNKCIFDVFDSKNKRFLDFEANLYVNENKKLLKKIKDFEISSTRTIGG